MREFETGATRDTDEGKLDFEACLCPLVLERYAEYVKSNRIQPDGEIRADDNWQKLFGDNHYSVCMKSAHRHFHDAWKCHRGVGKVDIEEAICACLFNLMAYLHKVLKENQND